MSSRALRKLQREHEQEQQLEALEQDGSQKELDKSEESEAELLAPKKLNAFDILNQDNEAEEEEDNSDSVHSSEPDNGEPSSAATKENAPPPKSRKAKGKSKAQNKKKGKKNKGDVERDNRVQKGEVSNNGPEPDEIDIALKSLSLSSGQNAGDAQARKSDDDYQEMCRLLSTDTKYLNASNEMKRLFGSAILYADDEREGAPNPGRRRGRDAQQLDLGGAVAGRNSPASRGQGLAGLALRRNVFMLGKEEWPKGTSGGLGMEVEHKDERGTTLYRFVHNSMYQDVQGQFDTCVESMDPQRMIQLLQSNPYHISTLLQVSEIAKQQGDHPVSGDLLERALFSFGRSVHSSFSAAVSEGRARLDFRRRENREFWLAAWRYIKNLGQRGTLRTTYEWAKLLLSLDPEGDPYCIHLLLDQLAIRAGQAEHFLTLSKRSSPHWIVTWSMSPNVQASTALAEHKLNHPEAARSCLRTAILNFPWLFAHLFQELNVGHIPRATWGKAPRNDCERFESELYITRAKDLWNTPEAISLLVEVAESLNDAPGGPVRKSPITLNEARHVILSDVPSLISLLPRSFTAMLTSASDPLRPLDDEPSYSTTTATNSRELLASPEASQLDRTAATVRDVEEYFDHQAFFAYFLPWLVPRRLPEADDPTVAFTPDDVLAAIQRSGEPFHVVRQRGQRMLELHQRLMPQNDANEAPQFDPNEPFIHSNLDIEDPRHTGNTPRNPAPARPTSPDSPFDDRQKRWLAGTGLLLLRDFAAEHGVDARAWGAGVDDSIVREYARRMLSLENRATRVFLMEYVLQQGTSTQVKEMVELAMEDESRGMMG